ncbi:MAG: 50S ribosomal protein L9 [Spirochaetaceae bacterium]|nr:50S ribosomal protein L9 [Spirochaetaceae bacterium]
MKIILYKEVPNLGEEGDVKVVADGYARNFLLPQKFAVRYTKATEMELAQKQKSIARRKEEKSKAASDTKTRIEALTMEVAVAAGEKGRLFGSVTSSAVVDYLASQGVDMERKKVELPEGGIKMVGDHSVKIKLYGGEEALLKVTVSASGEKAEVVAAPKTPKAVVEKEAADDAGENAESDSIEDNTEEDAETEIEE